MAAILSLAFFLSGAAALLFETLWLRRAGLMLGSSVWASSIVLAAFMTGLAFGNALAVRWAARVGRPLRAYALLEIGAGVAGTVVVLAMPALAPVLAPLFRALGDTPALANAVRLAVAFALVLLPTTAMGITLPVLTRALSRGDQDFGRVLGRLYGWNTLGGVMGAIAGELWLITRLGLRGTALAAAALNLLAAATASWLSRRETAPAQAATERDTGREPGQRRGGPRSLGLLAAAFLSGAALLGLEVIWFRFLQLFLFGTTLTFAFMLAVILLGIGAGGLTASLWLRRDPAAHRWLPLVAAAAALATTLGYAWFSPWYHGAAFSISQPDATLVLALRLMSAPALVSGVLFTLQGAALRRELPGASETAGRLTLVNTLGAMTGALGAGFVLLPALGMERSMFVLAALYGAVAALCRPLTSTPAARVWPSAQRVSIVALAAVAVCLALFPRGAMLARHLPTSHARFLDERTRVVALHEGVNQTTTLLRSEWGGEVISHRLVTNGHSMSGTDLADQRYMKMFVNWAVAVNPRIRQALLISYGLGSTAKALTDTRALTAIDVVDISPEILALAAVMFPTVDDPLHDPRVRVHVEDGRFFLQTSTASFDLITGEPPPPKAAGVVNLYSREYFHLLHDRLNDGGVATYWLPVEELDEDDARAVTGAFCAAFADCSLWTGAGAHWMLAGTRGLRAPADRGGVHGAVAGCRGGTGAGAAGRRGARAAGRDVPRRRRAACALDRRRASRRRRPPAAIVAAPPAPGAPGLHRALDGCGRGGLPLRAQQVHPDPVAAGTARRGPRVLPGATTGQRRHVLATAAGGPRGCARCAGRLDAADAAAAGRRQQPRAAGDQRARLGRRRPGRRRCRRSWRPAPSPAATTRTPRACSPRPPRPRETDPTPSMPASTRRSRWSWPIAPRRHAPSSTRSARAGRERRRAAELALAARDVAGALRRAQ